MRKLLLRLSFAAMVTLAAIAVSSSGNAQQSDRDPSAATPKTQHPTAEPQRPDPAAEAQMPASGDTETHEAHAFSGRVVKENGQLVLKDPVTKVSYKFDNPSKAERYLGKQVKVTGKLELNSNTIHVDTIEPIS